MPIPFVVPSRPWGPLPGAMAVADAGSPCLPLDVSGAALLCPHCGLPLDAARPVPLPFAGRWDGYEPLDGPAPPWVAGRDAGAHR